MLKPLRLRSWQSSCNHDRVVATCEIARKSWEDQVKAINNLKYQNQNIGPKNLEKLRESDGIEQWLATAGPSTSHKDQWHSTAGTTTSNLINSYQLVHHPLLVNYHQLIDHFSS